MYTLMLSRAVALHLILLIIGSLMVQADSSVITTATANRKHECVHGLDAVLGKVLHYLGEIKAAYLGDGNTMADEASSLISEIKALQSVMKSPTNKKRGKRAATLPYSGGMYGKRAAAVLPYSGGFYGKRSLTMAMGDDLGLDDLVGVGVGGRDWLSRELRAVPLNGGFYG